MRGWFGAVTAAAVVMTAGAPAAAADWTTVLDGPMGITAQFPGKAEVTHQTGPAESGGNPQASYELNVGTARYSIGAERYGIDIPATELAETLDGAMTAGITAVDGKETARRTVAVGAAPAREAEFTAVIEGQTMFGSARIFYRDGWFVSAVAMAPMTETADVRRMIQSVQAAP